MDRLVRQYRLRDMFVVGGLFGLGICLGVVLNAVGLVPPRFHVFARTIGILDGFVLWPGIEWENVTSTALAPDTEYTLRLIQAIGILLPLFTGLIRFTVDEEANVGDRVSDFLLLGVLGLVFAGLFAVIGGIMSDTAAILKISLIFVLSTLTMIGFVALEMVGDISSGGDEEQSDMESAGTEGKSESGGGNAPDEQSTRAGCTRERSEGKPDDPGVKDEPEPDDVKGSITDDSEEATDGG